MLHSKSIILKVVLISFVSSNYHNTSLRERIPIYLQEICPGSGVCLNDIIEPDNDLPSCCGACSCSEDCEVKGNCCFPNKDNDTISNTRLSSRYHSECLYPLANDKYEAFDYDVFQSYYMISSTAKDTLSDGSDNITATSCGEVKVAPWGSMYPVYSKTTGKIYKNSVCADAHNITDGELWRAYVLCERIPDVAFSSSLQNNSIPDHCYVKFSYKSGLSLLKSEMCYHVEHYESSCLFDSFHIPAPLSLSIEEIIASCESGLISPYKIDYANVFCFMCRRMGAIELKAQEECSEKSNIDYDPKSGVTEFTMIFYGNDFSETFSGIVKSDHVGNIACPTSSTEQTGGGCRSISCPLGQILSSEGGCFFPGNKWYTNRFTVVINLSSERTINISTSYSSIQNLKSPWPSSWTIHEVLYKATPVPMQTRDIVVIQYILFHTPFNPKSFISRVQNYISKSWLLKTNNETITLQAVLSRSSTFPKHMYNNVYENLYNFVGLSLQKTSITKLYFCDHVFLLPSEYSIDSNEGHTTLFNWVTNKTLHDLEYTIDDDEKGIVCLEDSGLYRLTSNNSMKKSPHLIIVQMLAMVYMTLIL